MDALPGKGEKKEEKAEAAYKFFGNVRDAAKNLGLTPSTFVRKRKQYQQKNVLLRFVIWQDKFL